MDINNLNKEELKSLHELIGKLLNTNEEELTPLERMIEDVLDNFDFQKVHNAMVALNWTWLDKGVPSVENLREQARDLLRSSAEARLGDYSYVNYEVGITSCTGGLEAQSWCDSQKSRITHMELTFVVTHSDSSLEDLVD